MRRVFQHLVFPLYHYVKRDGLNSALERLMADQWNSPEQLRAIQNQKLAELLAHAAKNVPYYRSIFGEANKARANDCESLLRDIPILTKQTILEDAGSLVSEALDGNKLRRNSTSGSTGERLHFYTDSRSTAFRQAAEIRSDTWTGWRLGDRFARLWGSPVDHKRFKEFRGQIHAAVTRQRMFSASDLSPESMKEYVIAMRRFRPIVLLAYPGPLEQFAIYCHDTGASIPSLKAIISSAETLWPHQRQTIEKAFGVKVFNRYGCREVGQISSECELHDGQHISADRLLIEVVDDLERPCEPGQVGNIIVTDLDNFGMPLIRYNIGDRGALAAETACSCGRGLPKLERIEGRTMDVIRTPSGRIVGGTFWTILFGSRPGIRQIQVVQNSLESVTIRFVKNKEFQADVLSYFSEKIKEQCGKEMMVNFSEVERINLSASGKQRLVISNLSGQGSNAIPE